MENSDLYNPFYNRSMIKKVSEFIGRTRELEDITERLKGAQSVSIVGDRRIGKSSLLYHLYLTGNERLNDLNNRKYQFLYINMHNPAMKTPELFAKHILKKLSLEFDVNELKEFPLVTFSELLESNSDNGKLPVLLIDEFEEIVERSELFNDDFIDSLRFCANNGLISVITASKITLREITDSGKLTSPFWNIFTTIKLREFAFDDALNETALFLEQYWSNLNIKDQEKRFLIGYPSKHPLKLQIVSYWVFQKRKMELNNFIVCEKIESEIASFFRSDSEKRKIFFKRELPKLPEKISWTTEFIGKQFSNLIKLKDLI